MSITIEELQQQIKDQAEASSRREREQELAHQKKLQDLEAIAKEELHRLAEEAEKKRAAREALALEERDATTRRKQKSSAAAKPMSRI